MVEGDQQWEFPHHKAPDLGSLSVPEGLRVLFPTQPINTHIFSFDVRVQMQDKLFWFGVIKIDFLEDVKYEWVARNEEDVPVRED